MHRCSKANATDLRGEFSGRWGAGRKWVIYAIASITPALGESEIRPQSAPNNGGQAHVAPRTAGCRTREG
jgi:hypothetical protein